MGLGLPVVFLVAMNFNAFQRVQQRADRKAHLNPKWFGEACTFAPLDFPNRTVVGNVDVAAREEATPNSQDLEVVEELTFHCSRHPSDERGGIDAFEIGDLLYRSRDVDPDQKPFAATGERRSENALTWTLVFTRRIVKGRSPDG